ncbi:MAG TPA: hypothetical protein VM782_22255 [Stellaceae bacterium]|nr:hypothetical protein [Stellaceae bacterium]
MSPLAWVVVTAIMLGIEMFLGWRIVTAFTREVAVVDPLFWLPDWIGFDFAISRARHPVFYWLGVLLLIVLFAIVLALFAAIAAINLKAA